jgi:hypothetical protein
MTSDNRLDRAIDEVAREMTAGEADTNLRVRVLADIERPRPFAWRPVFAAACAAGAVIALVIVAGRGRPQRSTIALAPSATVPAPSATVPAPSATVPALSATVPAPSAKVLAANGPAARGPAAPNPYAGPPLEEAPLTVEPMVVAPITPVELTGPEQLPSIAPISVAPLDAQGESK